MMPALSGKGPGSDGLRVEILTALEELPPLAERWSSLSQRAVDHEAGFFQSYPWIYHVARIRASHPPSAYRQHVAAVWQGEDLVCVWPLALFREQGAWIARSLDDPFGQFAGAVFASAADAAACVAAVLENLRRVADGLQLEAVIAGSALHGALAKAGIVELEGQKAVVVDLRPFATIKDFAATVNAKTRKNMRNLNNRLRRLHQVEHVVRLENEAMEPLIGETFDRRTAWLHENGRTSPAFRDGDYRRVATELARQSGVKLIGFSLQTDEITVSSQWGFLFAQRYYAYLSAMNQEFFEFSPGRLHLGMIIEFCYEHGIKALELMPPPADYKLAWSEEVRTLGTFAAPFSFKGRIVLGVANNFMPAVRRLSRKLPEGLRKRVVRGLNRN
jgi:CelD/BcsL family acetyltransferase involved in cellulose biosynthesis